MVSFLRSASSRKVLMSSTVSPTNRFRVMMDRRMKKITNTEHHFKIIIYKLDPGM
jgi:hypothetical protein